jgi:hypothetical protein
MEANNNKNGNHCDNHRGNYGGGGDRAYNEDKCGDGIVGTDERGAAAAQGDDTGCPFSKLCLHPRLVSALKLPARPFKLERLTAIQLRCIVALLP